MQLSIQHRTQYNYSETLNYTIQQLRLTPRDGFGQHVKNWSIRVNGHLHRADDTFGNIAHMLVIDNPHREINIVASGEVETGIAMLTEEDSLPLGIYLRNTTLTMPDVSIKHFAAQYMGHLNSDIGLLDDMVLAILDRVPYIRSSTAVNTTAAASFDLGSGVCQDHAHIFITCCRSLGLPARYVSGYLFTPTEDETHTNPVGSLMESHAWADVYLPEAGWISFDVSNGVRASEYHVRLATGLDYKDASPVSGVRIGGGLETMEVSVEVQQTQQAQQ